jgi:hypothetical protein
VSVGATFRNRITRATADTLCSRWRTLRYIPCTPCTLQICPGFPTKHLPVGGCLETLQNPSPLERERCVGMIFGVLCRCVTSCVRACADKTGPFRQGLGRAFAFNQSHMLFIRRRVTAQVSPMTVPRRVASSRIVTRGGEERSEHVWGRNRGWGCAASLTRNSAGFPSYARADPACEGQSTVVVQRAGGE